MVVLIGGGAGFVGRHLSRLFTENGVKFKHVSRQQGKNAFTWRDIDRDGLPEGCTAVVNLAGENILNIMKRWTEDFKESVRSSRVDTTRILSRAINEAKDRPKAFVCMSGVARYQPSATNEYTEDTPSGDYDFLSKLTTDWEAAADEASSPDVRVIKIRSGVVLARDGGMIQQVIFPFYFGLGGKIGSGNQWFPWIHMQDLIEIIDYSIKNTHVSGVLNGVAPQAVTNSEFTKAFGKALYRPTVLPLPGFVLNTIFGNERAKVMLEGQKVVPKRTLESGYEFIFPDIQSACNEFSDIVHNDIQRK